MNTILFARLPGFYAAVAGRNGGEARPLVVHEGKRVKDANLLALQSGVRVGMGLPEAKAMLSELVAIAYEEAEYLPARNAWLDVCLRYVDGIEPVSPAEAFFDLSVHPDPAAIAARLLAEVEEASGIEPWAGLCSTKWIARAAASRPGLRIVDDPKRAIRAYPVAKLLPLTPEERERLEFLGYRTVAKLQEVPLATFREQFGPRGLTLYQAIHGGLREAVHATYPERQVSGRVHFMDGAHSWEVLVGGLRRLLRRLCTRVQADEKCVSRAILTVTFPEGLYFEGERTFPTPPRFAGLEGALQRLMEVILAKAANETENGVDELRVQLPDLKPIERSQITLFSQKPPLGEQEIVVGRLRTKFGDQILSKASEVEEPRRKRVLNAWGDAIGWR